MRARDEAPGGAPASAGVAPALPPGEGEKKAKKRKRDKKSKKEERRRRRREEKGRASTRGEESSDEGDSRFLKRSRDEAKLLRKAERRRQEKIKERFGYSNEANPFGDSDLTGQFVWRKRDEKVQREGVATARIRSLRQADEEDERVLGEIESVRRRRREREEELAERDRLREEEQRLREMANHEEWRRKEELFHLEAQQIRSKIRILENRAEPIDILARNILLFHGEKKTVGIDYSGDARSFDISKLGAELLAPTEVFEGLDADRLAALRGDIETYRKLEGEDGPCAAFWGALTTVCDHHMRLLRGGLSKVERSAMEELAASSDAELDRFEDEIASSAAGQGGAYWNAIRELLKVEQAKRLLHQKHVQMLKAQMERLQEAKVAGKSEHAADSALAAAATVTAAVAAAGGQRDDSDEAVAMERAEAMRAKEGDEEQMDAAEEVAIARAKYHWADRHRPRKPRFFNKVRTGYEWNKYNKTHYDHDNPPPKTVQGYKFNIFRPDLIDKTTTPSYALEPADSPDFVILRFTAGPPYEDIAFRIVNKEWEVGRKRGFRCSFERGVLQLHFNFRRLRYRR